MIAARGQAWVALGIAGLSLVIGLIASRDDGKDPADELRAYGQREAARKRIEAAHALVLDVDALADDDPPIDVAPAEFEVEVTALLVRIDGREVSTVELVERARELAARSPNVTVKLSADADAPYERLIEVMDLLKNAGLTRIAFAATP